MNRISSLFVATTMAILPMAAFAQTSTAPAKDAAPAIMTTPAPAKTAAVTSTAPAETVAGKTATAKVIQPAKPDVKTTAPVAKTASHGVKTSSHHVKTVVPAKTAEPTKS